MTSARARRYAMTACGAAGGLSAIASAALVSALLSTPDRMTAAVGEGNVAALVALMAEQLLAAFLRLSHYL